jgi:phenylalanine-4-hydroxylase
MNNVAVVVKIAKESSSVKQAILAVIRVLCCEKFLKQVSHELEKIPEEEIPGYQEISKTIDQSFDWAVGF